MKNRSRLTRYALLLLCGISMSILNAEQGSTSTWQKWKKPILATTMIASGIVGCLLLDYFLHTQFTHKLDSTTRGLVRCIFYLYKYYHNTIMLLLFYKYCHNTIMLL